MKTFLRASVVILISGAVSFFALAKDDAPSTDTKGKKESVTFAVEGMSCSACTSKVTEALKKQPGVKVKTVSAVDKQAVVFIDPDKVKKADLVSAIEGCGYIVKGEKVTIPIKGMVCVSCSGKVDKVITAVDGVKDAEVSHEEGQAVVVFDAKKTSKQKIAAAIKTTGYKVGDAVKTKG